MPVKWPKDFLTVSLISVNSSVTKLNYDNLNINFFRSATFFKKCGKGGKNFGTSNLFLHQVKIQTF